jgi:hypothetical protein
MRSRQQFIVGSLIIASIASLTAAIPGKKAIADIHPDRTGYAALAKSAVAALVNHYYAGSGVWNMCVPAACNTSNYDWGADHDGSRLLCDRHHVE